MKGEEDGKTNKHSLQVVLASVLGVKAKWMFLSDIMGQDIPDNLPSGQITLNEEQKETHAQDREESFSSAGYSTFSKPVGKIGAFVEGLFFL